MGSHYFAYGSNLEPARLEARVPGSSLVGVAWLDAWRLAWNKRGADGSGKANIERAPGARVWGVVYALGPAGWSALDPHEPGYRRIPLEVRGDDTAWPCESYTAEAPEPGLAAFAWYKALVVGGARHHGLPADYVAGLESAPERPDPPPR